ncbi:MAG: sugar transferase [Acidimicrobiales bacterium]|nr:sugar transferase [Acidimicrobiales bacterium]MCB9395417.1 sugar transferase [Acidimicrobiaceae bacterium]
MTSDRRGLKAMLVAADLAVMAAAWIPVLLLTIGDGDRRPAESLFVALSAAGLALAIMRYEGLYLSRLCAVRSIEVRLITRSSIYTALGLVLADRVVFAPLDTHLRLQEIAIGAVAMLVLLVAERSVYRAVLRSTRQSGAHARDVVVLGAGSHAARLVSVIGDHPDYGMKVVGVLGELDDARSNGLDHLWLGTIDHTERITVESGVTGVVLSASASEFPGITALVKRLQARGLHVQVSNGLAGFDVQRIRQLHIAREPMIYLEQSKPRRIDHLTKRLIDVSISLTVLTVLSPVLLLIAAAIKSDGGPVFFKQERVGRHGKHFKVFKFRTMVVDAEARLAELMKDNERSGPLFKMDVDPRVTKVGRILRLSSLDEVPQLFNVLSGKMSIVGPRPALPKEVLEFDDDLRRRELVKPGITGLWQVEARDSPSFDAYRRLDLFYVDNWTVPGDLDIMLDTFEHLLGRVVRAVKGEPTQVSHAPMSTVTDPIADVTPIGGVLDEQPTSLAMVQRTA